MKNAGLTIRVDKQLKEDFSEFCDKSGISLSSAVTHLASVIIRDGKIPFVIKMVDYDNKIKGNKNDVRIMLRISDEVKANFSKICDTLGVSKSTVIKIFMMQCVDRGEFPFK